jgi:hypothetical protein
MNIITAGIASNFNLAVNLESLKYLIKNQLVRTS